MIISGFIYLLDQEGNVVYGKKYNSKSDRNRIIENIIKFYGLKDKQFIIQIAPYATKN